MRYLAPVSLLATVHLLPHALHAHGPALDYVGLGLLAILSGMGINGLGEAALIGAGVFAAHHKLTLAPVVLVAWAGCVIGGQVGWGLGVHGLRRLLTAPGPLLSFRLSLMHRSDGIYRRHHNLAILVTPTWTAGLHRTHWRQFFFLNALASLVWASTLGAGAYYLGRHLTDSLNDSIGGSIVVLIGVAIALLIAFQAVKRLRRARHPESQGAEDL